VIIREDPVNNNNTTVQILMIMAMARPANQSTAIPKLTLYRPLLIFNKHLLQMLLQKLPDRIKQLLPMKRPPHPAYNQMNDLISFTLKVASTPASFNSLYMCRDSCTSTAVSNAPCVMYTGGQSDVTLNCAKSG